MTETDEKSISIATSLIYCSVLSLDTSSIVVNKDYK